MNSEPTASPAQPDSTPQSLTAPLAIWLLVQLGVIALAAARVPLAAQYPEPAEWFAPHLLLSTQILVASLLFPLLLRDARCAAAIIATAIPFQVAAAYLAGLSAREIVLPSALADAWLIALALWPPLLQTRRARAVGVGLATFVALGVALLHYVRLEFSATPETGFAPERVSPLLTTVTSLGNISSFWSFAPSVVIAAVAFILLAARKKLRNRLAARRASTPTS